ncbi:MAG: UPF0179 family protein [Thermoplasmata archaeon]|nr:UPF0179 family protein [Thermoplasmata archaeon]
MATITLIGELLAKKGETFVYLGPLSECRDCKLKTVCFNLDVGKWYTISSVREIHHDCKIHENGVRVVEAEPVGIPASVLSRYAIEGISISFEPNRCSYFSCENYRLCNPIGINSGGKYQVTTVFNEIECKNGQPMKKVFLT